MGVISIIFMAFSIKPRGFFSGYISSINGFQHLSGHLGTPTDLATDPVQLPLGSVGCGFGLACGAWWETKTSKCHGMYSIYGFKNKQLKQGVVFVACKYYNAWFTIKI
jgi:hypothetical protein